MEEVSRIKRVSATLCRAVVTAFLSLFILVWGAIPSWAQTAADNVARFCENGYDCMPAWRWQFSAGQFFTNFGLFDLGAVAGSSFPQFFYGIAQIIWIVVLWLMRQATSLNVLGFEGVLPFINAGFLAMYQVVEPWILPALLLFGLVSVTFRVFIKGSGGSGGGFFKQWLPSLMALSVLVAWAASIETSVEGLRGAADREFAIEDGFEVPTASPAWLVQRIGDFSDTAGNSLATSFLSTGLSGGQQPVIEGNLLDCSYYSDYLRELGGVSLDGQFDDVSTASIAQLMSVQWETTYLDSWIYAQFNNTSSGRRGYCRTLENFRRVPGAEQQAITVEVGRAYDGSFDGNQTFPGEVFTDDSGSEEPQDGTHIDPAVLSLLASNAHLRADWTTASSCLWLGPGAALPEGASDVGMFIGPNGWSVAPEWIAVGTNDTSGPNGGGDRPANADNREDLVKEWDGYCQSWWMTDGDDGDDAVEQRDRPLYITDGDQIYSHTDPARVGATDPQNVFHQDRAEVEAGLAHARQYWLGQNGHGLGNSTGGAFIAIVIAFVHLLVFGGAALGSIIAQFVVVIGAIFLPFFLAAMVWPSDKMRERGTKYFRLLLSAIFARFVFILILGLLTTMTGVFRALIEVWQNGGAIASFDTVQPELSGFLVFARIATDAPPDSFTGGLFAALPPLLAYFAIKQGAKQLGFGNPLSFKGASGFVRNVGKYATDPSTHTPGRLGQRLRRYADPLSPRSPLAVHKVARRARNRWKNRGGAAPDDKRGGSARGKHRGHAPNTKGGRPGNGTPGGPGGAGGPGAPGTPGAPGKPGPGGPGPTGQGGPGGLAGRLGTAGVGPTGAPVGRSGRRLVGPDGKPIPVGAGVDPSGNPVAGNALGFDPEAVVGDDDEYGRPQYYQKPDGTYERIPGLDEVDRAKAATKNLIAAAALRAVAGRGGRVLDGAQGLAQSFLDTGAGRALVRARGGAAGGFNWFGEKAGAIGEGVAAATNIGRLAKARIKDPITATAVGRFAWRNGARAAKTIGAFGVGTTLTAAGGSALVPGLAAVGLVYAGRKVVGRIAGRVPDATVAADEYLVAADGLPAGAVLGTDNPVLDFNAASELSAGAVPVGVAGPAPVAPEPVSAPSLGGQGSAWSAVPAIGGVSATSPSVAQVAGVVQVPESSVATTSTGAPVQPVTPVQQAPVQPVAPAPIQPAAPVQPAPVAQPAPVQPVAQPASVQPASAAQPVPVAQSAPAPAQPVVHTVVQSSTQSGGVDPAIAAVAAQVAQHAHVAATAAQGAEQSRLGAEQAQAGSVAAQNVATGAALGAAQSRLDTQVARNDSVSARNEAVQSSAESQQARDDALTASGTATASASSAGHSLRRAADEARYAEFAAAEATEERVASIEQHRALGDQQAAQRRADLRQHQRSTEAGQQRHVAGVRAAQEAHGDRVARQVAAAKEQGDKTIDEVKAANADHARATAERAADTERRVADASARPNSRRTPPSDPKSG
ncbi:hypothetical protein [Euzebya pacifica]|uniref:hypothetical protein n=1 Tax=Euzebya pacifica TaxID=1608957 RepID=UPI001C1F6BCB|nr:hypothetical protein [Euzebya pacifica]